MCFDPSPESLVGQHRCNVIDPQPGPPGRHADATAAHDVGAILQQCHLHHRSIQGRDLPHGGGFCSLFRHF